MAALAVRRSPRNREHQALLEWIKSGAPPNVAPSARPDRRSTRGERTERHGVHLEPQGAGAAADYDAESGAEGGRSAASAARPATASPARSARPASRARGGRAATSSQGAPSAPATPNAHGAQKTHQNSPGVREREDDDEADPVLSLLETYSHEQADSDGHMERARVLWTDFCAQRSPRVAKPATYAAALEYTLSKLEGGQAISQAAVARRYKVTAKAVASRHEEIRATLALEPGDTRYSGRALSER